MIYLQLFLEFLKIGLFSFGGGYATLPFLYHMSETYGWFSLSELSRMLAISSITPGPVGLNVATFAGFKTAGIIGSITATFAIMLPSFAIVIFISKMLKKFSDNFYIKSALYALRPAAAAMIAAVGVRLFSGSIVLNMPKNPSSFLNSLSNGFLTPGEYIDIRAFMLLVFLFILSLRLKRDPLIYLLIGAVFGILLHFGHILNLFQKTFL